MRPGYHLPPKIISRLTFGVASIMKSLTPDRTCLFFLTPQFSPSHLFPHLERCGILLGLRTAWGMSRPNTPLNLCVNKGGHLWPHFLGHEMKDLG